MSHQRFLPMFVLLALVLGISIPGTILGVHLHRRSILREAQEEAQRKEAEALLLRVEGLLYSAGKRSGKCDTTVLMDLRDRIVTLQKQARVHASELDDAINQVNNTLRRCDELKNAELAAIEGQRRAELETWRAAGLRFYELLDGCNFPLCDAYIRDAYVKFPEHSTAIDDWSTLLQERRELWLQMVAWLESVNTRWQGLKTVLAEFFLPCPGCAGTGQAVCSTCDGTSWTEVTKPCSRNCRQGRIGCLECQGTGRIVCSGCAGWGYREMLRYSSGGSRALKFPTKYNETCLTCNGLGKPTCKACRGGSIKDFQCSVCQGKGTVQDRLRCSQCHKGRAACPRCAGDGHWHPSNDLP